MVYTVTDSKVTPHYQKLKNKKASAGDSSAVRRTKYSRGPEFDSQYPQDTSQPSGTPAPGDAFCCPLQAPGMHGVYTYLQAKSLNT